MTIHMDFTDLNALCVDEFGIPATLLPQSAVGAIPFVGIVDRPAFGEENLPGSLSGTNILRFWVDFQAMPTKPQKGDTVTVNGINYDLFEVVADHDPQGGATLKLRKNASNA